MLLQGGWGAAVVGAVTTVVTLGVIAEVMAFLTYAASGPDRSSLLTYARLGGLIFYLFHHVGVVVDGGSGAAASFGFSGRVTFALAALLGTFVGLWLLWRTGRAIGNQVGGSAWVRGAHGAKVAVPYAALSLAFAFLVRIPANVDPAGNPPIHPSYLAAALWPLGLALLAGFVGGLGSAGDRLWSTGARAPFLRAAIQGGARMMALALVLAFAGLLVLAPTHPDATADYFRPFQEKTSAGVAVVAGTALAAPNLAADLILFPSMGTCLSVGGSLAGLSGSACLLSWTQYPDASAITAQTGLDLPSPPPAYFLYLLVPLLAVVTGGAMAARKGGAVAREQALGMGALAGVVYGLLAILLAVLATITVKAGGLQELGGRSVNVHVGPELLPGLAWPFVWGIVGGAIGGLIHGRNLPTRATLEATSAQRAGLPDVPPSPEGGSATAPVEAE
jgi:Family of unknown function (DUF6350)